MTSSPVLDVWRVGKLSVTAVPIAIARAGAVLAVSAYAVDAWHVTLPQLHTVVFLSLVVMGQIAIYIVRNRRTTFGVAPSRWLAATSVLAVVAVSLMSTFGILAARIPAALTGAICGLLKDSGVLQVVEESRRNVSHGAPRQVRRDAMLHPRSRRLHHRSRPKQIRLQVRVEVANGKVVVITGASHGIGG